MGSYYESVHECLEYGHPDFADAMQPTETNYKRHRRNGETACDLSRAEMSWTRRIRLGHDDTDVEHLAWMDENTPTRWVDLHVCLPAGHPDFVEELRPVTANYHRHIRRGEPLCDLSKAEYAWYRRWRLLGDDVETDVEFVERWEKRRKTVYRGQPECDEWPLENSQRHRAWHQRNGTEPCPTSRFNAAWAGYEARLGVSLTLEEWKARYRPQQNRWDK